MRWPIRNQILFPFTGVLLAAVAVTSVSAAVLASRRTEREIVRQLNRVIETLSPSSFPWSANVLDMMHGLSGADFIVYDGGPGVTTLAAASLPPAPQGTPHGRPIAALSDVPILEIDGRRYFATSVQRPSAESSTLLVLYPVETWERARNEAAIPPLVVGAGTLVLLLLAALIVASRIGLRLRRVEQQVALIAGGEFQEVAIDDRQDEIQDLAASVNRMSQQLRSQRDLLGRTERTRLLGQLAGGIAHQLRNAATGARMAIQIHRRRCEPSMTDDSLEVALRQLALMEEQVRGLLSLGRTEHRARVDRPLGDLLADVTALVGPACSHHGIQLTSTNDLPAGQVVTDADGMRTALVNLVLNAIDAAGPGGAIVLSVARFGRQLVFDVSDTGPGPPPEIADNLFEIFVTGKPEGVGFGLALAKQVAEQREGMLDWERREGRTHFRLTVPTDSEITSDDNRKPVSPPTSVRMTETDVGRSAVVASGVSSVKRSPGPN